MNNTKKRLTTAQRKLVNAAIIAIVILAIVGVNVLTTLLVNKFPNLQADVTTKGAYTLNATTEEFLQYMDNEVKVTVLMTEEQFTSLADDYGSSSYHYQANQLLKKMSTYEKFDLIYNDISAASATKLATQYPDIDWSAQNNLILVECGEKYKMLTVEDIFEYSEEYMYYYGMNVISAQHVEEAVVSTIQKVTAENLFKVALSVGNGEFLNEQSQSYQNFGYVSELLEDNAYEVVNINLLTEELSDDIDALVMLAPSVDITNDQSEKITNWLVNGGNYGKTFMYVPNDYIDSTANIDLLLEQWGMKFENAYVYENDLTLSLSGSSTPQLTSITNYANETYTESLKTTALPVIMPYSLGVTITDDTVAKPLLTSSETADLLKLDVETEEHIKSDKALNYAAVGTKGNSDLSKSSNVIAWGSYDGLSTSALYSTNFNNASYFVNLFNTSLGNENEAIVIESVSLGLETLTVTSAQQTAVLVIFVFIIPLAVFALGVVVWVRRKNK